MVGHSLMRPTAVPSATIAARSTAMIERTGPTGSLTGRSLMMMTPSLPISPNLAGLSARKAPYTAMKVAAPAATRISALKLEDLPEDLRVAERIEPERVHVVPERGAASEQQHGERDYEEEPGTSASRSLRRKTDRVTIAVVDHGGPTLQADVTSIGRNSRESSVGGRQSQSAVAVGSRQSAVGGRQSTGSRQSRSGASRNYRPG